MRFLEERMVARRILGRKLWFEYWIDGGFRSEWFLVNYELRKIIKGQAINTEYSREGV